MLAALVAALIWWRRGFCAFADLGFVWVVCGFCSEAWIDSGGFGFSLVWVFGSGGFGGQWAWWRGRHGGGGAVIIGLFGFFFFFFSLVWVFGSGGIWWAVGTVAW